MSKNPQEMANMISRALQDNHGYGAQHPFCQQGILTKIVKQAQGFSKNRVKFCGTQLALTEEGAKKIAAAIAREDVNILRPYNMQHEYFYPLTMKLLIQNGQYPSEDRRKQDLEKCWHKIDESYLPGIEAVRPNGIFSDPKLSHKFFDALGSGSIQEYQNALGASFWTTTEFQKAVSSRKNAPDYTVGAPQIITPTNFNQPSQNGYKEEISPEQPKKSAMKNATTVMGMLGLWALRGGGWRRMMRRSRLIIPTNHRRKNPSGRSRGNIWRLRHCWVRVSGVR